LCYFCKKILFLPKNYSLFNFNVNKFKNNLNQTGRNEEAEMSFIEHLEELRWHLIRGIFAIGIFTILIFISAGFVFDTIILGPSRSSFITYTYLCQLAEKINLKIICIDKVSFTLTNIEMAGQFLIHIKSSVVLGFIVAFPYLFFEIWRFIRPGLYKNERQTTQGIVFFSSFFFFLGILFGYFILAPFSINFLGSYFVSQDVTNNVTLSSYVGTLTTLVLASGFIFELPMVVFILSKLQLINAPLMRKYRKHSFVAILFFAAIITPPDVVSQILIGFPLFILYEFSILIAARVNPVNETEE